MRHQLPGSFFQSLVVTLFLILVVKVGHADVMSSSNFKIQSDSINTAGILSTSSNYRLEDTAGEVSTGDGSSTNYNIKAGYQQMQAVYLSLTAAADVVMVPNLGGLTGGTATGSTAFLVTTDSAAGYTVTIQATGSPAMRSGVSSIADYLPAGGVPDFVFSTGATNAHFAYSPEGLDIAARFRDNSSACGVGSGDTSERCFDGLSTTPVEIVRRSSGNHPQGATTTVLFRVGVGTSASVPAGVYTATTTITALSL